MMGWSLSTAARTLWQEARGESLSGQQAVAHVIVNRLSSGRWGDSLDEVCRSEYKGIHQFSGWDRKNENRIPASRLDDSNPLLVQFAGLIADALNGAIDPTGGATHYYAKSISPPDWVAGATPCGQFGNQLFFKGVK